MKTLGSYLIALAIVGGVAYGVLAWQASLDYDTHIQSYWDLSDKASTIAQKAEYVDQFANALDKAGLHGVNSALFYQTPNTDFDQNFKALQSLQKRLHDIQGMDENSFQYQTAIQQITAQEQGEAKDMLDVFSSSWLKVHHYALWNPLLAMLLMVTLSVMLIVGIIMLMTAD